MRPNFERELAALQANLRKRTSIVNADAILARFQRIDRKKKSVLLQAGARCRYIYYIYSGALRSYTLTDDGKKVTIMLAVEDWWITDIDSFTTKQASRINIDLQSDAVLYGLSRTDFDQLIAAHPAFESAFRQMMQFSYIREQRRAVELIADSSEVRYLKLIHRYPDVEQRFPQKVIASYLGMSPEFLSSLRRKIREKS